MRWLSVIATLSACNFVHGALSGGGQPDADVDANVDAMIDAPPVTSSVYFVSVTTGPSQIKPGQYGMQVTAVLRNDSPDPIANIGVTLTFTDGANNRGREFRWRDIDAREGVMTLPTTTLASNTQATYKLVVDVLPWASATGPILINGAATFNTNGMAMSASPAATPLSLAFANGNAPIVVDTLTDESNSNNTMSLREAIALAKTNTGLDHITFAPTVFTSGSVLMLSETLGELPPLDGANGDIVIDGAGAKVTIAVDVGWENPDGRWPFRVTGGTAVLAAMTFKDMGFNYKNEGDLSANNCGGGTQLEGGAIRVNGGTLILEANTFDDADVAERNCYAALVRYEGGTNHRVVGNHWTNQSMDSMYINANVHEIANNLMDAGNNLNKVDEGIFIHAQGGQDMWVDGNLIADQEYNAVIADGSDSGKLYLINNTLVRNGRVSSSAVRRGGNRQIVFRNNFYIGNNPSAIASDNNGTGFDFANDATTSNPLCAGSCSSATQSMMITPANPMVANSAGATFADFAPLAGSPLLDSGTPYIDRNGSQPGHFNGTGVERGAVEAP